IVAALLVTTSGSILWTTAGIASDGPALAFAIGAVAVSFGYTRTPTSSRAVAAGALLGAGLVAKALAAPAGLAVALLLLSRRRPRDPAYPPAAALVVAPGPAPDSPAGGPLLFRPASVLALWLAAQFALLVYEPAFWRPHVAFLIAPLVLLVALRPPPLVALLVGAIVLAPWYWSNVHPMLWP